MRALSDSRIWVHRADGGAGYDSHGSLAWPSVSRGEEQTLLSLKNWGGGEYTFSLGTLFSPSDVDFEPKSSKVGVDKVDSHNECIAIREGKGTVVNV
jgi:hypothetical protein